MVRNRSSIKVDNNGFKTSLLREFEAARTQLAVAIAAETKSTPLKQRQYYLETADRMREFTKRLRATDEITLPLAHDWRRALEKIKQLPVEDKAFRLCEIFHEILRHGR